MNEGKKGGTRTSLANKRREYAELPSSSMMELIAIIVRASNKYILSSAEAVLAPNVNTLTQISPISGVAINAS
jgi:hypothetical protein